MLPVVQLKGVTHAYLGDREASLAIEDLSLEVGQGEFVSLVGPSGCGKTTLLSIIAGLVRPSLGEVTVSGRTIEGPSSEVGYMLQQDYLFPWRTILDNALLGLELTGNLTPESKQKTLDLLADMGLAGKEQAYPAQLSGGMRQRVALVRTLATDPGLLLLDEPFSALDYQIKLQLEDLVSETLRRRGTTAVLVTHDLSKRLPSAAGSSCCSVTPAGSAKYLRCRRKSAARLRCMRATCRALRSFFMKCGRKWSWQERRDSEYERA